MPTPRLLPGLLLAAGTLFGGLLPAAPPPPLQVVGNEFQDPAGNRVILRGASLNDARYNITDDNNRGVDFVIDQITDAAAGWHAKVIRIPVHPGTFFLNEAFDQAKADDHFDNYLLPTINTAAAKGLYAIVELHYVHNPFDHATRTNQFWAYLAPRLKDFPHVLFELYNEPKGNNVPGHSEYIGLSWSAWKGLAQPWINTIRHAGANNVILVGGPQYCQHMREAATDLFADANLGYVAHVYPLFYGRSGSTLAAKLDHELGPLLALRPVIITEWGYVAESQFATREFYGTQSSFGNAFRAWVDSNQVSWTSWCADDSYEPAVFSANWQVRSGGNYHGDFLRQWLYDKRNSDQPSQAP